MSLSSVRSETALRNRLFSSSRSFWRFTLLGLQPTELLTPPIMHHLAHADLADCVHHVLPLRDQNIDLPQLRDDPLQACIASLPLQSSLMSKTYLKSDHFNGGGSVSHNAHHLMLQTALISQFAHERRKPARNGRAKINVKLGDWLTSKPMRVLLAATVATALLAIMALHFLTTNAPLLTTRWALSGSP
jgi:hypothetical protein